jgi:hypothetical protein
MRMKLYIIFSLCIVLSTFTAKAYDPVADTLYVNGLYLDVLLRERGPGEDSVLNFFLAYENLAETARIVVLSDEGLRQTPINFYRANLFRDPEPSVLVSDVAYLAAGGIDDAILSRVLKSQEYRNLRGGNLYAIVRDFYPAALGRVGSPDEINAWIQRISTGTPIESVVDTFLTVNEHYDFVTNSNYLRYLGRSAELGALVFWRDQFSHNHPRTELVQTLVTSAEYWNRRSYGPMPNPPFVVQINGYLNERREVIGCDMFCCYDQYVPIAGREYFYFFANGTYGIYNRSLLLVQGGTYSLSGTPSYFELLLDGTRYFVINYNPNPCVRPEAAFYVHSVPIGRGYPDFRLR